MWKGKAILGFCSKHFLPIGTLFIIPFGILLPAPAVYIHGKLPIVQICIVTLFFVIGMKFRLKEIQSAVRCYKEIALGLIVVLLLTPVIGTKLLLLPKFRQIPRSDLSKNGTLNDSWSTDQSIQLPYFGPEEFRIGLQILCTSPCASAFPTVVVTAANGDRALTLLIAVMATVISVFTVPVMVTWLIPALHNANVSVLIILLRVILFILLPLTVGRLLRFTGIVKKIVVKLKTYLKFVTSGALLVMFWVKISQAASKGVLQKFSPWMILALVALGTAVITSFLVITLIFASLLQLPKKSILAVTILSSARNSSISIAIIENLPNSVGDKDLVFFPIVFVYLAMIVVNNSFGSFMTIKKEENDIEQGIEELNDKPLDQNNNSEVNTRSRDTTLLCAPISLEENLSLVVNPLVRF